METQEVDRDSSMRDQVSCPAKTCRFLILAKAVVFAVCAVLAAACSLWLFTTGENIAALLPPAGEVIEGGSPFSFAVVGDNRDNMSVFEEILGRIKGEDVDFILHTGDIVKRANERQFNWVLHEIGEEKLGVPIYAVPGNHDIDEDAEDMHLRYRFYGRAFGQRRYWFSYANVLFVAFDNAMERSGPDDLKWLDDTLARHRDEHDLCFVYMHVPTRDPRPGHNHAMEEGADGLVDVLKKHRVSAVFAGHIHGYLEDDLGDLPVYVTGGAGADLYEDAGGRYNYVLCEVGRDGSFKVNVKEVDDKTNTDRFEYAFRTGLLSNFTTGVPAALIAVWFAVRAYGFCRSATTRRDPQ